MSKNTKKIYLAIPYSFNPKYSFKISNEVAAQLINEGHYIFAPISHSHPIANTGLIDHNNHKIWLKQDLEFVKNWCTDVYIIVLRKDGNKLIKESTGVQREIRWAKLYKKSIHYLFVD